MTHQKQKYGLLIIGIALSIAYSLVTRFSIGHWVTTMVELPTILGIISLVFADNEKLTSYRKIIFIPWLTFSTFLMSMFLIKSIEQVMIPIILGTIPLMFGDIEILKSNRKIIFITWLTVSTIFLTMYVFGNEDSFIWLLAGVSPLFILGTIGALIYRIVQINRQKKVKENL